MKKTWSLDQVFFNFPPDSLGSGKNHIASKFDIAELWDLISLSFAPVGGRDFFGSYPEISLDPKISSGHPALILMPRNVEIK